MGRSRPAYCPAPKQEVILNAIISGLLAENRLQEGVIVDAGAYDGSWACFYFGPSCYVIIPGTTLGAEPAF